MIQSQNHIVQSFNREIAALQSVISQMGGLAEEQFHQAILSLREKNQSLTEKVISTDKNINDLQHQIDNESLRLIALRQPMALDLRIILSSPKIGASLERIGDYTCNIAKRAQTLFKLPNYAIPAPLFTMADIAEMILHDILDGLMQHDLEISMRAWERDIEVDKLHSSFTIETLDMMKKDPEQIVSGMHLLFIAKNIERIADHATNIAEMAHFIIKGKHIDQKRPKYDTSSRTII